MNYEKQELKLKEVCRDLLQRGQVVLVIGFTDADDGMYFSTPFFMRSPDDVSTLRWDDSCSPNLAKYVLGKKGRIAVIAKPCDSRALSVYVKENQIPRDNLYIIGLECHGIKDEKGNKLPGCKECKVLTPPLFDVLIGSENLVQEDPYSNKIDKKISEISEISELSEIIEQIHKPDIPTSKELKARLKKELSKCIMCFSCRQICYGCYCDTCFIDRNIPAWSPSSVDLNTKLFFHLGRAMHLAGRCVECGACQRGCPSGVDVRYLISGITDFCEDLYNTKAGMDLEEVCALQTFNTTDREIGFLGGESSADSGNEDRICCNEK
ncbi:MAG: hypothetical protein Q7J78_02535 [Clostridiales bacterium]|nr:hypothetical protein [Clostridiales bacterium]